MSHPYLNVCVLIFVANNKSTEWKHNLINSSTAAAAAATAIRARCGVCATVVYAPLQWLRKLNGIFSRLNVHDLTLRR